MPDGAHKGSFLQAYNAQAAVDSTAQIIVAAEITQQSNDKQQLVPMLQQVIDNLHGKPQVASADTGYWSSANVTAESLQGIDLHVATERQPHSESKELPVDGLPEGSSVLQQMRDKLKTEGGKTIYKMRKQIVEPVFGYIKEARGFRRFRFRGIGNLRSEWRLICATHNLLKLFRELSTLQRHSNAVFGVAVSPDGRRAVSASGDNTLKVWDLEVGSCVATFTCDASAQCCAFAGEHSVIAGDFAGRVHFLQLMEES